MKIKLDAHRTLEIVEGSSITVSVMEEAWGGVQPSHFKQSFSFNQEQAYMVGNILKEWSEKKGKEW